MPDSEWQRVTPQEAAELEQKHAAGEPPEPDSRPGGEKTSLEVFENGAGVEETTTLWLQWTADPPPKTVGESCHWCPGHEHRITGEEAPPTSKHAPQDHWLERYGLRYDQARVRGTEIRRTTTRFIQPDGEDLAKITMWHRRTIDHVRDGIDWIDEGTVFPCLFGRPFSLYAGLLDPNEKARDT